jgi:hypothetical protein
MAVRTIESTDTMTQLLPHEQHSAGMSVVVVYSVPNALSICSYWQMLVCTRACCRVCLVLLCAACLLCGKLVLAVIRVHMNALWLLRQVMQYSNCCVVRPSILLV